MIDPTTTINQIRSWSMDHPTGVQRILDCCEALELSQPEAPGWDGLSDPKKVAKAVEANALFNAASGEATRTAYTTARNILANNLVSAVADNLESYTEQWEAVFNGAAEKYEKAAEKLPTEFTANQVTTFEPEQFSAFTQAREAAGVLHSVLEWLLDVRRNIPGQGFNLQQWAREFLILEPESVSSYARIQLADTRGADEALRSVDPVLLRAVHSGARLSFQLPKDAEAMARFWEEQRQGMADEEWARVRGQVVA